MQKDWTEVLPDEPWDGPRNVGWSDHAPRYLHCPLDPGDPRYTSYLAITYGLEPRANLGLTTPISPDAVLVVEVHNSGILWTEPRDLNIDKLLKPQGKGLASLTMPHGGSALLVSKDGEAAWVTLPANLRELRTILEFGRSQSVE